jgi:ATP-dependent helicase HepA
VTRERILSAFRDQGRRAYQAEFAAEFLREDSARHHLLVAPGGLGKAVTSALVANHMVEHRQARRILVLAPTASAVMWQARFRDRLAAPPVVLVHSRAYRELEAGASPDGSPWPEAIAAIVPTDVAVRPGISRSLAAVHWDLVILGELHPDPNRQPTALLRHMLAQGVIGRSLLITATPLPALEWLLDPVGGEQQALWPEFQITKWLGELPDWDGKRIALPPVQWKVLDYTRSEDEARFLSLLQEQSSHEKEAGSPFHFETEVLIRRAASSGFAVEQTLRTISRKLNKVRALRKLATVPEEQYGESFEVEDNPRLSFTSEARQSYLQFVIDSLNALELVKSDTKLACLLRLLDDLAEDSPGKVCVLAAYADTVSYLHSALSEIGSPATVLTGGLKYAVRQQVIRNFLQKGRLLLTTVGALGEECDLSRVRHVIHYDLPTSPSRVTRLEERFNWINRTTPCSMYALQDLSGAVSNELPSQLRQQG